MKDSKLLLGLIVGAVVGVAVGYLAATDKKEELLNELNNFAGKIKDSVSLAVGKFKEGKCCSENKEEEATA
jgi:gas vesicle protein